MTRLHIRILPLANVIGTTLILSVAAGCSPSPPAPQPQEAGPIVIECQVFFRPSMGEPFEESTVTLGPGPGAQSAEFDDLSLGAQLVDDAGEGPSLSLVVTDRQTGRETARQLYQIDRSKGLINQFIGGHGFTGLNYTFHPASTTELQYFCQVK